MKATVLTIHFASCDDPDCDGWYGSWSDPDEAQREADEHNARFHDDAESQVFG